MKLVFADTFFFFAILNRADPLHQRAADWVITELADGLSGISDRERFTYLYQHFEQAGFTALLK